MTIAALPAQAYASGVQSKNSGVSMQRFAAATSQPAATTPVAVATPTMTLRVNASAWLGLPDVSQRSAFAARRA
jgi:hypothetical protein